MLARGYSEVYLKEYQRKDRAIIPVELRTYLMLDEAENPCCMWAIVRDITETQVGRGTATRDQKVVEGSHRRHDWSGGPRLPLFDRQCCTPETARIGTRGKNWKIRFQKVLGEEVFGGLKSKLDECFEGKVVVFEMKYQYPELGEG